jgi:bile acid-coenzyme A ligase
MVLRSGANIYPAEVEAAVSAPPRDDSGTVRRTLLCDERAAWMKEGRAFRIMPSKAHAD